MEEKIMFQYITDSRVYRRKMIFTRVLISVIVAGGLSAFVLISLIVGILLPVVALFVAAIWIIYGLQYEMTYTIFNTRFVIKNRDKRINVPLENVVSVKYGSGPFDKKYLTGTITVKARAEGAHRVKTYKMKHVFDGRAGAEYIAAAIRPSKEKANDDEKD
ncbi:MAG: hypothetical protein J1F39_01345 [Clostridiales bacterium]|nr:hypothetical protein [Clostridiales bacterium]